MTEAMVDAAHRQLPGISNRVRVRRALEAAAALIPDPERPVEVPMPIRLLLTVDEEQLRADVAAAIAQHQAEADMPSCYIAPDFIPLPADEQAHWEKVFAEAASEPMRIITGPVFEPHVTEGGLEGPGVTDASGQACITVNEPRVLAGVSEIAAHLQAGRSTVAGWVKNADSNAMPAPLATLAAGPVYDLEAVEAWYRDWKGNR